MTSSYQIGFTGDVMLGRTVNQRHRNTTGESVWGSVADWLDCLDGLFVNLECCLSTRGEPWTETYRPFHFRADPDWAVAALETGGVDYCSLANNHVLDYGEPALLDTLDHLDEATIAHSGAGRSRSAAFAPAIVTIGDITIAVISLTDNTPEYAAGEHTPGTAYITIDAESEQTRERVTETIRRARDVDPDLVIASLHWGPNMVEEPPASFETFARWLIDAGIDLIHGHSAHIFQGVEVYDGKPIFYDTGDFVDDYAVDPSLRNDRSFLFQATLSTTGTPTDLRLIPIEIDDCRVHLASDTAAHWSRDRMRELSRPYGTSFTTDGPDLVLEV